MSLAIPKVRKQINDFDKVLYKFTKSFDKLYRSLEMDFGGVGMAQNCIGEVRTGPNFSNCEALL